MNGGRDVCSRIVQAGKAYRPSFLARAKQRMAGVGWKRSKARAKQRRGCKHDYCHENFKGSGDEREGHVKLLLFDKGLCIKISLGGIYVLGVYILKDRLEVSLRSQPPHPKTSTVPGMSRYHLTPHHPSHLCKTSPVIRLTNYVHEGAPPIIITIL